MSEEMSNVDAAWLRMEQPNNLMMITGLFIFDQPVDFQRVKTTLSQRLLLWDRFRQKVVYSRLGSPRWEFDRKFDIANHVHRVALPAPGDQATLQALVSDLASTPLDYSKPLWQYHLVEGYRGDGCVLVCRLHHCIADGIALGRVLLSMTDETADAVWTPPVSQEPSLDRSPLQVIMRPASAALGATRRVTGLLADSADVLTHPSQALDLARLSTETTMALGRLLLLPPDPKTIFKGPLGVPKCVAWSPPLPLAAVKAIGKATGATVNDVLLSCVAGALRRYAQVRGQPVEGLNIRAFVPVNLRQETEKIELGNRFGLVILSLPLGIGDPLERLAELRRRMNNLKDSQEAVVAFGILNAIGMAPADIENLVVNIFGLKGSAVMTNVPGPRHQIYFAGVPVKEILFWVPQSGRMGMGVSIFSYNNQVWLGLITDQGLVPDPDSIIAHFRDELLELGHLVEPGQAPAAGAVPVPAHPQGVVSPPPSPATVAAPPIASAAAPALEKEPTAQPLPGDDLTAIPGIGSTFAAKLRAGGITTYAGLAASTPQQLATIVQAPDWRRPDYQRWIEHAQALLTAR